MQASYCDLSAVSDIASESTILLTTSYEEVSLLASTRAESFAWASLFSAGLGKCGPDPAHSASPVAVPLVPPRGTRRPGVSLPQAPTDSDNQKCPQATSRRPPHEEGWRCGAPLRNTEPPVLRALGEELVGVLRA